MTYLKRSVTVCVLFVLAVTTAVFVTLATGSGNVSTSAEEIFSFTSDNTQAISHIELLRFSNTTLSDNIGSTVVDAVSAESERVQSDMVKIAERTDVNSDEIPGLLPSNEPAETTIAFNFTTGLSTVSLKDTAQEEAEEVVEVKEVKPEVVKKTEPKPMAVTPQKMKDPAKPAPAPVVTEKKQPEKPTVSNKYYTNNFYPGLKMVYPSDWKFSTSTKEHYKYSGLLERTIMFSKGDTNVVLALIPKASSGCRGGGVVASPSRSNINNTGISRYQRNQSNGFYSRKNGSVNTSCYFNQVFPVQSNITHQDYPGGGNVEYWGFANVSGTQHLEEADTIISRSTIR